MDRSASTSRGVAWDAVADAAGVGAATSLLDLGCGRGAFCGFAARRGAIVHGIDAEPQPVEDAIGASRLEVLATGEVPAPIEMADDAALAASLSRAGIVADRIAVPAATSVAPAAAPYRQADGSYRFENRLRFWILRRRR